MSGRAGMEERQQHLESAARRGVSLARHARERGGIGGELVRGASSADAPGRGHGRGRALGERRRFVPARVLRAQRAARAQVDLFRSSQLRPAFRQPFLSIAREAVTR
ncbi:MAG: hypothetical protein NFCOHLIN_02697 [Gammaproteobacteria bacterium]|nr:hypothetical protein [Gammaproteobacteria bacterium]